MVSISYFRNLWLKVGDKRIGHRTILRPLAVILMTAPFACAQSSVVDQKTSLRAANRSHRCSQVDCSSSHCAARRCIDPPPAIWHAMRNKLPALMLGSIPGWPKDCTLRAAQSGRHSLSRSLSLPGVPLLNSVQCSMRRVTDRRCDRSVANPIKRTQWARRVAPTVLTVLASS